MTETPGIDAAGIGKWFGEHVDGADGALTFELVAGGRSNLTYRVRDAAGHAWALRRPPVSHVLATAHDMAREHRVMAALDGTGVPVPGIAGFCDDPTVTGAPFTVMEFVDGLVARSAEDAEKGLDEDARARVGGEVAGVLARLHGVDPTAVGLADFGRPTGYVERQLKRWSGQFAQMKVEGVDDGGLVESVGARLVAALPAEPGEARIVHGDYRLDNLVLSPAGTVRAVLDWEISTLGDPMADLGLLMVYWSDDDPGEDHADGDRTGGGLLGAAAPTKAPGIVPRRQVLETYRELSGRSVEGIGYFMAFGYWKLACILQGVYARYLAGAGAGDKGSVDSFPKTVAWLARRAATILDETPSDLADLG